jgi:hypothetical protein
MIKDFGNMVDPAAGLLDSAKSEVIVLGSVKSPAKATDLLQQPPSINAKVAEVHPRQKMFGRPIRLEMRANTASLRIQLVFVTVDDVSIGSGLQEIGNLKERIRT